MSARSVLSTAVLGLAVLASVATSEAPPPDTITPIAPYDNGVLLYPGDTISTSYSVGVPTVQLGQITTSWASAGGLIYATGAAADVRIELEGSFDDGSVLVGTDPSEPYEDNVLVDGLMAGCVDSSGTCWATWTVTVTHTGGTGEAEFHWSFDPFVSTSSGPLTPSIVEL